MSKISVLLGRLSAVFLVVVCSSFCSASPKAQQIKHGRKTFSGPIDSEVPYPVPEGTAGQKDAAALTVIKESVADSLVPEHQAIEVAGVLATGSASVHQEYPTSFVIENGNRFRLDINKVNGIHSLRIDGSKGHSRLSGGSLPALQDDSILEPLAFPSALLEIASRTDASVVDDGLVTIGEYALHKVTITLFQSRTGSPVCAALYLDTNNHLLKMAALPGHSQGDHSLQYLKVMTYGAYRQDNLLLLPHEYSTTVNGQTTVSLRVTNINVTASHDASYFSF